MKMDLRETVCVCVCMCVGGCGCLWSGPNWLRMQSNEYYNESSDPLNAGNLLIDIITITFQGRFFTMMLVTTVHCFT
jgi:hypothetical protein